jgi:hypothetical protein
MCWFTLTPSKGKKHQRGRHSSDSSCVEDLVRVHSSPSRRRFTDVKVKVPSGLSIDMSDHHHHHPHLHPHLSPHLHPHLHHHHRHHLHPLHLNPFHDHHHHHHDRTEIWLHGDGRRRSSLPPGPPPPTRDPSRCRPRPRSRSPAPRRPSEPIYRTQIVVPADVRETTRTALGSVQPERHRGRLRRVAGYEVLGAQVPFDWDCISSTVDNSSAGGRWVRKKVKSGGLKYPPFASMDRWM